MHFLKLSQVLLAFSSLPLGLCLTKRTAQVKIRNDTPDPITAAAISHKYSDVYKNQLDFDTIASGKTSADALTVEYNTGAFTTGRDWWLITYHRERADAERKNELKMWYSDPSNFRSIIDTLEKAAPAIIKTAINVAKGSNPAYLPAAKAAQIVAKQMNKLLFNSESTAGFKQHILRSEDERKVTIITIHGDNTISFQSESGNSKTVTSTKWIAAEHA
ncbi:uncharacterized protein N0V89_007145 [Didymosphaeria variabile]|uniref:Up-regulated in Daf-2 domain-containing protein n=1 Tax=Didymosphaeria variabile TaxID=1932322 RepID=A0A9W8XKB0_9PLEO|nr:uncharacterized protein N0V89_007145 [Didymosphaeria variabile]KAJ4351801.1 hypothetical protein N0V89_007145 [Didymosphaeria variabile]